MSLFRMGIVRVAIWVIGVIDLLSKFPLTLNPPSSTHDSGRYARITSRN